jgi:hypothetical protein
MFNDTRRLTVALDHLNDAYEELTNAQGQTEQSMGEQAVGRAKNHLDLVLRRLDDEQAQIDDREIRGRVEQANAAAHRAWQSCQDALNDWDYRVRALGAAVLDVQQARETVREVCGDAAGEPALRS